jgi:hypothetical protein
MSKKRIDRWLPSYIAGTPYRWYRRLRRASTHTHVMFLVCDHFEPRHASRSDAQISARMQAWRDGYAGFQQRCRDEFGMAPLHTWFYPPHHGSEHLASLAAMAHDGMGEVELHYHHDGDTATTLERDLRDTITEYNHWGLLLNSGAVPAASFGFIHGDWALGNSGGGHHCGVNDELTVLKKLGCWADLTMPSGNRCQTRTINAIYYGEGDPHRPNGHDRGVNAAAGKTDTKGLMLIQGPLGVNWRAPSHPRIENASLTTENWGRPDRIRKWLDCHVHVRGRPEWLFIKLHTHGAMERDFDALFGDKAMALHRELQRQCNDGKRFTLHYVTARQAYNIATAAEHGHAGNPADYLDFQVPAPATRFYSADARHTLLACSASHLRLGGFDGAVAVRIRSQVGPVTQIDGKLTAYEIDTDGRRVTLRGSGIVELHVANGTELQIVEGASTLASVASVQRLTIDGRCVLEYQNTHT